VDFLQLLLAINVLILAFSLFWIFHLYGKLRHDSISHKHSAHNNNLLSKQELDDIKQKATHHLEATINRSVKELESTLQDTVSTVTSSTQAAISGVLGKELKAYQASLEELRHKTTDESKKLQQEFTAQKQELTKELKQGIDQQRQAQMDLFNDRLNDVVSSYLVESLDKNVDLGSQMKYIITSLEAQKADIKKDVLS